MTDRKLDQIVEILLVEDNPGDVRLIVEVLKEGKIRNRLNVALDGEQALAYLRREGEYQGAVQPDIILLDLNLPKIDGHGVLAVIKEDPALRHIPVIVLTTSEADQDILKAYEHHANCYITKPVDLEQFLGVVRSLENFWLTIVKLPGRWVE
ncbi:response regulator [Cohnella sp. CFH 77786]|uniref:response regulator n=1 Tax=Cohnella sp. CFH 77786 TaxID=2662265 RepID=UPI001C6085CA|nr:response regulator [Cohnella sp. CFH 77786]MBW5445626.1 response regulator [Cohnella sp. CFH 77786]